MPIISQETWDNMPKEEKEEIIKAYQKDLKKEDMSFFEGCVETFEQLFGKENLQSKLKIRTWEDCQKMNEDSNFFMRIADNLELPDKVYSKCIATLKIAKLIELGYGGMVTDEEWKDRNIIKYCITRVNNKWMYATRTDHFQFIAFHTSKQMDEFMSYPENVKLVEQYHMI